MNRRLAAFSRGSRTLWRRRPARFLRSASLRLAAVYGLLFALSSLALVFFFWFSTTDLMERQVETAIVLDAQGLLQVWHEGGGLVGVQMAIEKRLESNVDDDAIYQLSFLNRVIDGNVAIPLPLLPDENLFYEIAISRAGQPATAKARIFPLPGGFELLVGRDVRGRAELERLLRSTLLSSALLVAGLAVIGGVVMRNLFRRMVADVSSTAAAIARGDLARRVRRSGRGDEFDRMAEAINTMLDRIGRLMDGVRQISNAIAHDLRTPIARARARLEDAAARAQGEAELHAAVERAVADLDGITAVFQALMRIAEIEAGARRAAFADVDLGPQLADLADLYGALAEEKQVALQLQVADTLPVYGDRDLIQQAVANLLDNAIKFSPPGGRVAVAAGAEAPGVSITVIDQGPGIPEADRPRAAERFFRGEQARSTPGSGLGLALVQAVAHLHDGRLVLEDARPGLRASLHLQASRPVAKAA